MSRFYLPPYRILQLLLLLVPLHHNLLLLLQLEQLLGPVQVHHPHFNRNRNRNYSLLVMAVAARTTEARRQE